MDWTIRPASDAGALVPLMAAMHALHVAARPDLFRTPPDNGAFLAELVGALSEGMTALATVDGSGAALGYALFAVEERGATDLRLGRRWGVLHHVAVDAAHRRRGIGSALVESVRARLRGAGVERMHTNHWAFNVASAALMRGAGFAPYLVYADAPV